MRIGPGQTGEDRSIIMAIGRSQKFFQRGAKLPTIKKVDNFSARSKEKIDYFPVHQRRKWNFLRFSRCYRPNLKFMCSLRAPKARAKSLGYFVGAQHMTSSFSNFRGSSIPLASPAVRRRGKRSVRGCTLQYLHPVEFEKDDVICCF